MNGPSPHLSWAEMACHDGAAYPEAWRVERAVPLAVEFERVRAEVGQPLTILSAYRTEAYNATVPGSAKSSQHMQGRALDLKTPAGMTVAQLLAAVLRVAHRTDSKIRGVGDYEWGVHMDIRPSDHLARWSGAR